MDWGPVLMTETASIYDALAALAITTHRVVNPRTIPGRVEVELDRDMWKEVDGHALGYLRLFGVRSQPKSAFRTNLIVVLTRVIVDNGIDLAVLGEHAFTEARRLPDWREEQAAKWPAARPHSGWSVQSGTYTDDGVSLYSITQYAIYQRANVGYLLQATGTTTVADRPRFGPVLDKVVPGVNFEG